MADIESKVIGGELYYNIRDIWDRKKYKNFLKLDEVSSIIELEILIKDGVSKPIWIYNKIYELYKIFISTDKRGILPLEEIRSKVYTLNKNINILSDYYKITGHNNRNRRFIKCECSICSHEWDSSVSHILNGHGCKKCKNKLKHTIEEFEHMANNFELKLISGQSYKNANTRLTVETKDGYLLKINYSSLKLGEIPWFIDNRNEFSIHNIKLWLKINNKPYELLSKKYDGGKSKLLFKCLIHNIEFEMCWSNLYQGNDCYMCAKLKVSGENSYLWKGGVTDLHRYLRGVITIWKSNSIKKSDFKCDICGSRFDHIHHLHPFKDILEETLMNTECEIKGSVNEYTSEELKIISDECIRLHNFYGDGVTLCKKHHVNFHRVYGNINNNEQQYINFKLNSLIGGI